MPRIGSRRTLRRTKVSILWSRCSRRGESGSMSKENSTMELFLERSKAFMNRNSPKLHFHLKKRLRRRQKKMMAKVKEKRRKQKRKERKKKLLKVKKLKEVEISTGRISELDQLKQ